MKQNTEEWIELRKTKIGASDAPIIMGVSPYSTPYKLWEEKTGISKREENEAMRYGQAMEDIARRAFEDEYMCVVEPKVVIHPEMDWMMASLDGLNIDAGIAVEIKNANKKDHEDAINGKVPEKYYPQLQHQLEILFILYNINSIYYYSYKNGSSASVLVNIDPPYIKNMISKEYEFFLNMQSLTPPPLNCNDYIHITDRESLEKSNDLEIIRQKIKELKDKEAKLKNDLIKKIDGNAICGNLKFTRYSVKGSVDYSCIPELSDVDLDKYRKKSTYTYRISSVA